MRTLVTGGAGYIGSHTLLQLLGDGHQVLVYDNFSNSSPVALDRVRRLSNSEVPHVEADIRDRDALDQVMGDFKPEIVIHFAGLKAVGESAEIPLEYYAQNVNGTIELLSAMQRHDCSRIVFSSSATVYGEAEYLPYDENHVLKPTNAYGRTKYFIEEIIRDWVAAWQGSSAVLLRYFNPVGAHASGEIGEDPNGIPNNLMPYIAQVATGKLEGLSVFGDDFETRDGTGERDYIHVVDLANAHLAAVNYTRDHTGCEAINVGTGSGKTVKEMISAFQAASGQTIPYSVVGRRPGDVAQSIASVDKARKLLGWEAKHGIADMCESIWRWQSKNPDGYKVD